MYSGDLNTQCSCCTAEPVSEACQLHLPASSRPSAGALLTLSNPALSVAQTRAGIFCRMAAWVFSGVLVGFMALLLVSLTVVRRHPLTSVCWTRWGHATVLALDDSVNFVNTTMEYLVSSAKSVWLCRRRQRTA